MLSISLILWINFVLPLFLGAPVYKSAKLIVFGDSLSSTHPNIVKDSNSGIDSIVPDLSFYSHTSDNETVRFSNGLVWPEYVSTRLGMDLMNFAKGGATFDNSVVQGQGKAGLTLEDVKTQIQMAVNSSIRLGEKDVVALWAGANDVMLSTMAGAQISSERLLALMESSLQSILFGLHPKTILVADHFAYELMPDKTLGNSLLPQFGFDFTDKLSHRLKELSTAYPETRFILLNARTITLDIHKCPSKYGFDPALLGTPCLPYYATKDTASLGLCGDVDGHVFFDEYHPTTRVHNLLADKAASLLVG